jgi:hypothetical protein
MTEELLVTVLLNQVSMMSCLMSMSSNLDVRQFLATQMKHTKEVVDTLAETIKGGKQ